MFWLTGASGTLGRELKKILPPLWAPSHQIVDITKIASKNIIPKQKAIDLIIHCAAYTDVAGAELNKQLCYDTNVIGTRNLASLGIPMLYISTSYVFDGKKGNYSEEDYTNTINFYGFSKLCGEYESRRTKSVVIRCLFKPRPFEHETAFTDQYSSGVYADEMAKEIAIAVREFKKLPPTINIGGERTSTFDLASKTRSVTPIKVSDIESVRIPKDTSLNCSLWRKFKNDIRPAR